MSRAFSSFSNKGRVLDISMDDLMVLTVCAVLAWLILFPQCYEIWLCEVTHIHACTHTTKHTDEMSSESTYSTPKSTSGIPDNI